MRDCSLPAQAGATQTGRASAAIGQQALLQRPQSGGHSILGRLVLLILGGFTLRATPPHSLSGQLILPSSYSAGAERSVLRNTGPSRSTTLQSCPTRTAGAIAKDVPI